VVPTAKGTEQDEAAKKDWGVTAGGLYWILSQGQQTQVVVRPFAQNPASVHKGMRKIAHWLAPNTRLRKEWV
jgi:hypothetical protein